MKKTCPKCDDQQLVDANRGVAKCPQCGGSFLAPGATLDPGDAGESRAESHDGRGGPCPSDKTIMTRTEVHMGADRPAVHLERCSSCRGVWFDAGEWAALADRQLIDHLDELWSLEWRTAQRRARDRDAYDGRLRETFGPELYAQLQSIATRLRGHDRRSQALAFLREASSD